MNVCTLYEPHVLRVTMTSKYYFSCVERALTNEKGASPGKQRHALIFGKKMGRPSTCLSDGGVSHSLNRMRRYFVKLKMDNERKHLQGSLRVILKEPRYLSCSFFLALVTTSKLKFRRGERDKFVGEPFFF